jgi:hypothetical protein
MKLNYTHRDSTGKLTDQSFVTTPENATTTSYNLDVETTLDLSKLTLGVKEPIIDVTQDKTTDVIDLTQEPSKESQLQSLIKSLQEAQKLLEMRVATLERWKNDRRVDDAPPPTSLPPPAVAYSLRRRPGR